VASARMNDLQAWKFSNNLLVRFCLSGKMDVADSCSVVSRARRPATLALPYQLAGALPFV